MTVEFRVLSMLVGDPNHLSAILTLSALPLLSVLVVIVLTCTTVAFPYMEVSASLFLMSAWAL